MNNAVVQYYSYGVEYTEEDGPCKQSSTSDHLFSEHSSSIIIIQFKILKGIIDEVMIGALTRTGLPAFKEPPHLREGQSHTLLRPRETASA